MAISKTVTFEIQMADNKNDYRWTLVLERVSGCPTIRVGIRYGTNDYLTHETVEPVETVARILKELFDVSV